MFYYYDTRQPTVPGIFGPFQQGYGPGTPPPFQPGFQPGGPGGPGGQGGPGGGGPPMSPPPGFTPSTPSQFGAGQGPSVYAIDPGAIRPCTYQFVYLWLEDGRQFWAWLTFVGRRSVAGFRWTGFRWVYFGTDTRNIDSFSCF